MWVIARLVGKQNNATGAKILVGNIETRLIKRREGIGYGDGIPIRNELQNSVAKVCYTVERPVSRGRKDVSICVRRKTCTGHPDPTFAFHPIRSGNVRRSLGE